MPSTTVHIRIHEALLNEIDRRAKEQQRSRHWILADALSKVFGDALDPKPYNTPLKRTIEQQDARQTAYDDSDEFRQ